MPGIEKFDPSTLMQGVRDRIKATFIAMIPDPHWDLMIKKEVDDFFRERDARGWNERKTSGFHETVNGELEFFCREKVKEFLSRPEFKNSWDANGVAKLNDALEKCLVDAAPAIFAKILSGAMQQVLQNLSYQVR